MLSISNPRALGSALLEMSEHHLVDISWYVNSKGNPRQASTEEKAGTKAL